MAAAGEINMAPPGQCCPHCNKQLPPPCPKCGSFRVICNGKSAGQNYRCNDCSRQYAADPARRRIDDQQWQIVDSLLVDRIEVAVIHRATGISKRHIYNRKLAMES